MMNKTKQSCLTKIWDDLENGINEIYHRTDPKGMDAPRYMSLYTNVYNYLTNTTTLLNSTGHQPHAQTQSDLVGQKLYDLLKDFLEKYLNDLLERGQDLMDDNLLSFYTNAWEDYRFSSKVLNGICDYLNRYWVRQKMSEGRKGYYDVYQLALVIWRDVLFARVGLSLTKAILKLIDRERQGTPINSRLISGVLSSYVELGLDIDYTALTIPSSTPELAIYRSAFEEEFLIETRNFYTRESNDFLNNNTLIDYMRKVEHRITEEYKRVGSYLHKSTESRLIQTLEEVLIKQHIDLFHQEFQTMLDDYRRENLSLIYRLVLRIPEALNKLKVILENHIISQGIARIEKCGQPAALDPVLFVTTILNVHHHFEELVREVFDNDAYFVASIDKACEKFINNNNVTKTSGSNSKPSELMAKYCDQILRKSQKVAEDAELEDKLKQVITVFRYLVDKDVFQKFYTKFFGRRLIHCTSANDDAEMSMISKLKEACGYEYTSKLQRMYQDIAVVSKEQNENFREEMRKAGDSLSYDLYVQILNSGSWPLQQQSQHEMKLPPELQEGVTKFEAYYHSKFNGRKLFWMTNTSRGEIQSYCFKTRFVFTASTVQMAVLLQYNAADSYTLKVLATNIGTEMDIVKQVVAILIKARLLYDDDNQLDPEKSKDEPVLETDRDAVENRLKPDTVVSLALGYKNKKVRVNINVPLKAEVRQDQEKTHKNIEEDRKLLVQASIVRIMKTRKTLSHQNLMLEVLDQLSYRFKPSVPVIKKCIDVLIEKEYLQRDQSSKETYKYIA